MVKSARSSFFYRHLRNFSRWWAAPERTNWRILGASKGATILLFAALLAISGGTVVMVFTMLFPLFEDWWWVLLIDTLFVLLVLGAFIYSIAFPFSLRMTGIATAKHSRSPQEILSSCVDLLRDHNFILSDQGDGFLRAYRNEQCFIDTSEREWQAIPQDISVRTIDSSSDCTLHVSCFPELSGSNLAQRTAAAIAALDDSALLALDREILKTAIAGGRLASSVQQLVFTTAVLVGAGLGGMGLWIVNNMVAKESEEFMLANVDGTYSSITRLLQGHLSAESARAESLIAPTDRSPDVVAEAFARHLDIQALAGIPVVAFSRERQWTLLRPTADELGNTAVREEILENLKEGDRSGKLSKAGEKVLYLLPSNETSHIKKRLGIETSTGFAVGGLIQAERLAMHVKGNIFMREMRLFQRGTSYARIQFGGFDAPVSYGMKSIKEEDRRLPGPVELAVRASDVELRTQIQKQVSEFDEATVMAKKLAALFFPPSRPETFYVVPNGVQVFRVYLSAQNGAMNGFSAHFDQRYGTLFRHEEIIWVMAGLIWALLVIFPLWWGTRIAARIAKPVLEIRDAMRCIANGDYSVRIAQTETDEVGQLQGHLNRMAEELQKREAIKELMGKYLSKQVADQILGNDADQLLAHARKEITVLFADVRGFTSYAEKHEPEQVTKSLNEYFEAMVDVIAGHEGVLDKYIGDGLMVVFGSPVSQPDHALRAVLTALEMQASLQSLNLRRQQRGDQPIYIGIGVNTGLAISGNLGSIRRMEFTVIGDTVNTAARLESRAERGQILIGKGTYVKVKERIDAESMGSVNVKGKSEPVEVWIVKGLLTKNRSVESERAAP